MNSDTEAVIAHALALNLFVTFRKELDKMEGVFIERYKISHSSESYENVGFNNLLLYGLDSIESVKGFLVGYSASLHVVSF